MYNIVNIYKKGIQELRISEDIKTCYTILNQYRKRNLWTLNRKVLTFAYKSIMRTKYDPNYTTNDMNLTFPLHISYSRALVHMVYISQWEWKVINVIMFLRFFLLICGTFRYFLFLMLLIDIPKPVHCIWVFRTVVHDI